ncbi:unnamed protein product [Timema podura]|uniref:Uncharacterized protein n=1 Tax=Timema podura TaxID=61482 RepID=A0ABN7NGN1_TIMPD|nr:unnamed protein product [Timema podura]
MVTDPVTITFPTTVSRISRKRRAEGMEDENSTKTFLTIDKKGLTRLPNSKLDVTAFYAECRQRQICLNASIWTKSNFSGMSVGVNMIGEVSLFLGEHGEQYDFTLPAAYARSIISIPWIELGGKVNINCPSTGYLANIIFHTKVSKSGGNRSKSVDGLSKVSEKVHKPFYGGKVNQVTAEVKNETGAIISRVQGEWNNHFEFTYGNGETKTVYVDELPVCKKRVRPLSKQGKMESRKLWCNVTHALREGDISAATEYKRDITMVGPNGSVEHNFINADVEYKIKLENKEIVIHANRLKLCCAAPEHQLRRDKSVVNPSTDETLQEIKNTQVQQRLHLPHEEPEDPDVELEDIKQEEQGQEEEKDFGVYTPTLYIRHGHTTL